jgi:hypothetical protein
MLDEMLHLAESVGDSETVYENHGCRLQEYLELGERASIEVENERIKNLAASLKQPLHK